MIQKRSVTCGTFATRSDFLSSISCPPLTVSATDNRGRRWLGKMLRINADGTIPTNNPFYNTATGNNRAIWALGLRNPFTFAFQPDTTRLLINDVGQSTWEEINDGIAGSNYGWPTTEGPTSNPAFRSGTTRKQAFWLFCLTSRSQISLSPCRA
ncbi:MAG TPA: PQQ-dependent sugar dehydrogenase [Chthoniobacterales bacterium]|nr:PQQ-dependent sugar dehydrogenase [Chthoniobacterales bacterium]